MGIYGYLRIFVVILGYSLAFLKIFCDYLLWFILISGYLFIYVEICCDSWGCNVIVWYVVFLYFLANYWSNCWLCEIVIIFILLWGLKCLYAYNSATVTENLEYHLEMSTFAVYKLISELSLYWTVWVWFSVMNCGICFSYCFYFVRIFRMYFAFILWVWSTFSVDCTLRRIEAKCCQNLHTNCKQYLKHATQFWTENWSWMV